MKKVKILKVEEFNAVKGNLLRNIQVQEVKGEAISTCISEPLYESESLPSLNQKENAIIALPECEVTIEALTNTITQFLKRQSIPEEMGFTIGNFFSGDYKSGGKRWTEKSLCVKLFGGVSDKAGTIAVTIEIMQVHNLSRALIVTDINVMEITRDGSQVKPLPQNRIRRIGD